MALQDGPIPIAAPAPAREVGLPLPRRGEMALGRARSLAAGGRLREALAVLDAVRPADPQKPEADRLRADIQRQLLELAANPAPDRAGSRGEQGQRRDSHEVSQVRVSGF